MLRNLVSIQSGSGLILKVGQEVILKVILAIIPAHWMRNTFPDVQLCFTGKCRVLPVKYLHISDTNGDILWSLPSPSQMLGGGFILSPPKSMDYLTLAEKQEERWF